MVLEGGMSVLLQFKQPKLEIKKDIKGMVTVPGATIVECTSAAQLMATLDAGQKRRHVSSTQVSTLLCEKSCQTLVVSP